MKSKRMKSKDINVSLLWQEVDDVISQAVGELNNSTIKTTTSLERKFPQCRPSTSNNSTKRDLLVSSILPSKVNPIVQGPSAGPLTSLTVDTTAFSYSSTLTSSVCQV